MTVREFDGVDDSLKCSIGALSGMEYGTVAGLVKRRVNQYQNWFELHTSGGSTGIVMLWRDLSDIQWRNYLDAATWGDNFESVGDWWLYVARKITGPTGPRLSAYNFTTATWVHGNAETLDGNATAPGTGGVVSFERADNVDWFDGRVAARAAWSNTLPWAPDSAGDTAVEAAGLHTSLQAWLDATPSACWSYNQAAVTTAVTDLTGGGADQTSRTGTTVVDGDDPSGFSFALGGGGVTGSLAATLPTVTADLTGAATVTASLDGALPSLLSDLAGSVSASGSLAGSLPALAADLSGTLAASGVVAATLPTLTADLSGAATVTGTIAGQLPALTAQLDGAATVAGALDGALPAITAAFAGSVGDDVTGALAGTLPAVLADLSGALSAGGSLSGTLPAVAASLSGDAGVAGALAGNLATLLADLSGEVTVETVLAATLPTVTADLTGTVTGGGVTGQLDAALPAVTATFAGELAVTGVLAATLPALVADLAGPSGARGRMRVLHRAGAGMRVLQRTTATMTGG